MSLSVKIVTPSQSTLLSDLNAGDVFVDTDGDTMLVVQPPDSGDDVIYVRLKADRPSNSTMTWFAHSRMDGVDRVLGKLVVE